MGSRDNGGWLAASRLPLDYPELPSRIALQSTNSTFCEFGSLSAGGWVDGKPNDHSPLSANVN
jgi:hypothetical protein